jgi:hypothetical protein
MYSANENKDMSNCYGITEKSMNYGRGEVASFVLLSTLTFSLLSKCIPEE